MFDAIARRYDLLNRMTSLGLDRRWRRRMVRALELRPGMRLLDLATGTADVALAVLDEQPDATVLGIDPSPQMLAFGRAKIAARGRSEAIELHEGEAGALPLANDAVDAATIAFGIRNVPDRPAALGEMVRVVKPGGRVAVLELTEPRKGLLARLARWHIHTVVPTLGAWLSGRSAYRYLEQSIAAFPPPAAFADSMRAAGMTVEAVEPLSFGAVHLFVGRVARGEVSS